MPVPVLVSAPAPRDGAAEGDQPRAVAGQLQPGFARGEPLDRRLAIVEWIIEREPGHEPLGAAALEVVELSHLVDRILAVPEPLERHRDGLGLRLSRVGDL